MLGMIIGQKYWCFYPVTSLFSCVCNAALNYYSRRYRARLVSVQLYVSEACRGLCSPTTSHLCLNLIDKMGEITVREHFPPSFSNYLGGKNTNISDVFYYKFDSLKALCSTFIYINIYKARIMFPIYTVVSQVCSCALKSKQFYDICIKITSRRE